MTITKLEVSDAELKDWNKKTRVFIWPDKENVMENMRNRRYRPKTLYRKEIIPKVLEKLELPADTKVLWSQKAGCSCGCSPGFIINSSNGKEVHVEYSGERTLLETAHV